MAFKLEDLVALMARLRASDGCPWDRQQSHESLKPYLLEETYEVLEAIDKDNPNFLKEELGDLLLQVLFHAQIATERSEFTIDDVAHHLHQKLIRRHPHVFENSADGEASIHPAQVVQQWESIKRQERVQSSETTSTLDGIPKTLPALQRACQVQKRASRSGIDWTHPAPVLEKLQEEFQELFKAVSQTMTTENAESSSSKQKDRQAEIEAELGDVLFSFVNVARFLKVNPEEALRKATNRFSGRFQYMETRADSLQRPLNEFTESELTQWWEEAKAREHAPHPDE